MRQLSKRSNINVEIEETPDRSKRRKSRRRREGTVQNRKWQLLEFIRKNEPVTIRMCKDNLTNIPGDSVNQGVHVLLNHGWLKREENDIYDEEGKQGPKSDWVYRLGSKAKQHIEKHGSFLHPDNPYDVGENGERLEEVMERKVEKVKAY